MKKRIRNIVLSSSLEKLEFLVLLFNTEVPFRAALADFKFFTPFASVGTDSRNEIPALMLSRMELVPRGMGETIYDVNTNFLRIYPIIDPEFFFQISIIKGLVINKRAIWYDTTLQEP